MSVLDLCKTKVTVPHSQLVSHPSDCPALVSPLAGQPPQQGREGEAEWGGFVNFFLFYVMLRHFHTKLGISRSTSVENLHKSGFKVSPKLSPLHLMLKTSKISPMIHQTKYLMTGSQGAPPEPDFLVPTLRAVLTSSLTPFGCSGCVTHATVQWLDSALEKSKKSQTNPKTIEKKPIKFKVSMKIKKFQYLKFSDN